MKFIHDFSGGDVPAPTTASAGQKKPRRVAGISGGPGRSRTFDRRIKSPLLYQLSYEPRQVSDFYRIDSMSQALLRCPRLRASRSRALESSTTAADGFGIKAFAHQQGFATLFNEAAPLELAQGPADRFTGGADA